MEIKQTTSNISQLYSQKDIIELVNIRKYSDEFAELLNGFAVQHDNCIDKQCSLYVLIVQHEGDQHIVGVIKINPNDVRRKFNIAPDDTIFHEFTSIVLEENLFNLPFLIDCFREILKQEVNIVEGKKEVFWFDLTGKLYSQVVESSILKKLQGITYYFYNQSEYLASKILESFSI